MKTSKRPPKFMREQVAREVVDGVRLHFAHLPNLYAQWFRNKGYWTMVDPTTQETIIGRDR